MKFYRVFLFVALLSSLVFSQEKDPVKILDMVKQNFSNVKDYEADAHIKVNMDMIKVPEMDTKIYFKQPNKMKIDSKGFAMLPRQAFNFSPSRLTEGDFNALYVKDEKLQGVNCAVLKIIPNDPSSGIILSTVWVDRSQKLIKKIESQSRQGISEIEFIYDGNMKYPLPSAIKFTVDSFSRERQGDKDEQNQKSKPKKGTVTVNYSNYKVNKGLSDSIFK